MILEHIRASLPKSHRKQAGLLTQTIISESHAQGFDPVFVLAVIQTESQFNPIAIGGVGEIGLMQIRPETAEWMANKLKVKWRGKNSLKNPITNVKLGIAYMAWLRTQMGPNSVRYVAAYNMGPKAVRRLIAQKIRPKEYRGRVMMNYELLYKTAPERTVATAQL
jgi:soluble lytic murein transglycosylase